MGKKAPDAPDYAAAAEAQGKSSREVTAMQTYANRPDQYTPFGSSTWTPTTVYDPSTGTNVTRWTQNIALDPDMQAALDAQQAITRGRSNLALGMLDRAQNEFGPMMDWSQFQELRSAPDVPGTENLPSVMPRDLQETLDFSGAYQVGDPNQIRQQATDAAYQYATSRLDPMWEQRMSDLDIQLRNQGLTPGTEAYDRAMGNLERARTDAYAQAANQAFLTGGAESDRLFGQMMDRRAQDVNEIMAGGQFTNAARLGEFGMGSASREQLFSEGLRNFEAGIEGARFDNTVRQQQIAEEMQRRGFSLNEINAILTGQQVGMPSMPGFTPASRANETNHLGAAQLTGQANLDAFNAEQAAFQGLLSGLGGLAGGFFGF